MTMIESQNGLQPLMTLHMEQGEECTPGHFPVFIKRNVLKANGSADMMQ